MYHVRLLYDFPGWAYWRRCYGIAKHAPDDFQVDVARWCPTEGIDPWPTGITYDLVLQLSPAFTGLRRMAGPQAVLVGGLNVGYEHIDNRLDLLKDADHIVVNNYDCWHRLGKPSGMTWISNGVDRSIFRVTVPIEDRAPRILWIGSDYHCRHTNIKGWDEVLVPLRERLTSAGIPCEFDRVDSALPETIRTTEEMVEWYNSGTIYLCTSSSEGTPNPALEAASCGCAIVSTPVGNMPELGPSATISRDVDDAYDMIRWVQDNYIREAHAMQERITAWDWQDRAKQYYALFRRLIRRGECKTKYC